MKVKRASFGIYDIIVISRMNFEIPPSDNVMKEGDKGAVKFCM